MFIESDGPSISGALTLDLARMPRGSTISKNCSLKLLDPDLPTIDLFKMTRIKAWWPFALSVATGNYVQAVSIERMFLSISDNLCQQPLWTLN